MQNDRRKLLRYSLGATPTSSRGSIAPGPDSRMKTDPEVANQSLELVVKFQTKDEVMTTEVQQSGRVVCTIQSICTIVIFVSPTSKVNPLATRPLTMTPTRLRRQVNVFPFLSIRPTPEGVWAASKEGVPRKLPCTPPLRSFRDHH